MAAVTICGHAVRLVVPAFVAGWIALTSGCIGDLGRDEDDVAASPEVVRDEPVDTLFDVAEIVADAGPGSEFPSASGAYNKCGTHRYRLEFGAAALVVGRPGSPAERIDAAEGWTVSASGDDDLRTGEPWVNLTMEAYRVGVRYKPDPRTVDADDAVLLIIVGECVPVDDTTFSRLISEQSSELTPR